MPRIYSALYQPYTYDELLKPVQAATEAHKEVEKEYTDSMMIVDALRSRAEQEPNAPWALNIINYANQLEGYATDLMQNGLTGTTPANLMSMHSGFGKTVTPVAKAIERQDALQKIRDLHVGDGMIFSRMPNIQEIIDNPSIGLTAYDYNKIYERAKAAAAALSARNITPFGPSTYKQLYYRYGSKQGFTEPEINAMREDDPDFNKLFSDIVDEFGFMHDSGLDSNQISQLQNAIASGAMAGFTYKPDYHYGTLPQWAVQPQNPTTGTGRGLLTRTYDGQQIPQFRPWIKPKVQEENNQLRNKLNKDPNIVFGYDENGAKINPKYIDYLYTAMNGGFKFWDKLLLTMPEDIEMNIIGLEIARGSTNLRSTLFSKKEDERIAQKLADANMLLEYVDSFWNPFTKQTWDASWKATKELAADMYSPRRVVADEYFQNQAKLMDIKKGDSKEVIAKKMSDYLTKGPSYSELSDAVVGDYIMTPLDSENFKDISAHYSQNNNNVLVLGIRDDGTFYPSNELFNPSDYIPILLLTVKYSNHQPSQTVVLWRHKSRDKEILSLYHNPIEAEAISKLIDEAWEKDITRKNKINEGLMELLLSKQSPDLIINNDLIHNVDDDILNSAANYWYQFGHIVNPYLTRDAMLNMLNGLQRDNSDLNKLNTFELIYAQLYYYYQYLGDHGKEHGLTQDMCNAANTIALSLLDRYNLEIGLEDDIAKQTNNAHYEGAKSQAHSVQVPVTKIE